MQQDMTVLAINYNYKSVLKLLKEKMKIYLKIKQQLKCSIEE